MTKLERKKKMIELIKIAKQKQGAQLAVKGFNISYFVRYYSDFICDLYNVKKDTSSFGLAISDFTQDYKTDSIRMIGIDNELRSLLKSIEKEINPLKRLELGRKYNVLVDEFRELNKPIAKFVRLWNSTKTNENGNV